jgi:hypothetical protein
MSPHSRYIFTPSYSGRISDSLARAGNDIARETKQMGAHGAHEFASGLLGGSAYVLYPRGTHDDAKKEQPQVEREM